MLDLISWFILHMETKTHFVSMKAPNMKMFAAQAAWRVKHGLLSQTVSNRVELTRFSAKSRLGNTNSEGKLRAMFWLEVGGGVAGVTAREHNS